MSIAEAQRQGGICGFVDVEHALDPAYAARIGVDVNNLYISQPDTGEQALEIAEALIRSNAMDVVVVDSVAALVPRAEIEGEMGDSHVGLQARLMSQALRKLTGVVKSSNTCMIFTNQLRQKIGVMFGNPETTTGGMALKFYASVRLDIRRIESIKQGDATVGNRTRVTVKKNKVAPPFRTAEFDIMYNEGISTVGDILDLGVAEEVVVKRGAFFSYGELRLGQGRENAKTFLAENPVVANEIDRLVRGRFGLPVVLAPKESVAAPRLETVLGEIGPDLDTDVAAARKFFTPVPGAAHQRLTPSFLGGAWHVVASISDLRPYAGTLVANGLPSSWQISWIACRPDMAAMGTMPPGSTHWPAM